jgi:hypothetical protein
MGKSAHSRMDQSAGFSSRGPGRRRGVDRGNMFDIFIFISLIMRTYIVFQQ